MAKTLDESAPERIGRIGAIGIGRMGAPMLRNLARAGYPLSVWARRPDAAEDFARTCNQHPHAGEKRAPGSDSRSHPHVAVADSLDELVATCAVIVLNVSDTADVQSLVQRISESRKKIATHAHSNPIVIDHSTIDPIATREIAAHARAHGIDFIDAPVSGGIAGAENAALTVFLGGDAASIDHVRALLDTIAATVTHIGPSGSGQITKACNQHLVGTALLALGDILALCEQTDVDSHRVRAALLGGFAQSRVLDVHGARLLERDLEPGFTVKLHAKDAAIVRRLFATLGIPETRATEVDQSLEHAIARGQADCDSRVIAANITTHIAAAPKPSP